MFDRGAAVLSLLAAALPGALRGLPVQVDARLVRQPDVSERHIAFVHADDIWIVDKHGGLAHRLTTAAGAEAHPKFSPDGARLAFTGNYDGNPDVYVLPVLGGVPYRVTYHPAADRLIDWSPDGASLLFASTRESPVRINEIYSVPATGGLPAKLSVPHGEFGALMPDGRTLLVTPTDWSFTTWKRYRGGLAPDIWSFDLESFAAVNLTDHPAVDSHPMPHGETLYFLSDRGPEARQNIWALDGPSGDLRQVTRLEDHDIHFPSIGPSEIVFEAAGLLYLMDPTTGTTRTVSIEVVTDASGLRPREVAVEDQVVEARISPSGQRVVVEARGELFSLPAGQGTVLDLTNTSGVAERSPAWSPDGEHIAYWSDASGEYELTLRPAGGGPSSRLTSLGAGYHYVPRWSPDSRKMAFMSDDGRVRVYDLDSGGPRVIATDPWRRHGEMAGFAPSWSPDSRWLAFDMRTEGHNSAVFLYDTETDSLTRVTSGFHHEFDPVFDPDGQHLYFFSNRELRTVHSELLEFDFVHANPTRIVAVPLRSDTRSPVAPRNANEPEGPPTGSVAQAPAPPGLSLQIGLADFERRLVVLPVAPGRFAQLAAAPGRVVYLRRPSAGTSGDPVLAYYDVEARREVEVLDDVDYFDLSADGERVLVEQGGALGVIDLGPDQAAPTPLRTSEMRMHLDRRSEWKQLFADAWRFLRDFFYDEDMHGVDWVAMRDRYAPILDHAASRSDVSYVIGEMIGELNASHVRRFGGDLESGPYVDVGLLGVEWEVSDGAYRVAEIVEGPAWAAESRSPLAAPGLAIAPGDYVLAVNGTALDPSVEPWAALQGLAGDVVILTVASGPRGRDTREVIVEAMRSDRELRYASWVEANRRRVSAATGGRVGYIHVPNTAERGHNELVRSYLAQVHLDGLIIDERFNEGGWLPDRLVELLDRDPLNFQARRHGPDDLWPRGAHSGPKVMLINGWAGSGGDAFPEYFRKRGLGPIIGMRTWGGRIGLTGSPDLIDGGVIQVPTYRNYDPGGGWFAEGHGVEPDIIVEENLSALAGGRDVQLERAIETVMDLLRDHPPTRPQRPPPERRTPPGR